MNQDSTTRVRVCARVCDEECGGGHFKISIALARGREGREMVPGDEGKGMDVQGRAREQAV